MSNRNRGEKKNIIKVVSTTKVNATKAMESLNNQMWLFTKEMTNTYQSKLF